MERATACARRCKGELIFGAEAVNAADRLEGKRYTHVLDKPYRWEAWAAPKGKDGKLEHGGEGQLNAARMRLVSHVIILTRALPVILEGH